MAGTQVFTEPIGAALLGTGDRPLRHRMRKDSRTIPGVIMAEIWMRLRAELSSGVDPRGGGEMMRVLRGGSFAVSPVVSRGTFRNWDYPIRRQIFAGFRCARDA